jgi:hypothetical protein
MCYDPNTGYVWSQNVNNTGMPGWTQPPPGPCTVGVFWPLANTCYDPVSGYLFNRMTMAWEEWGDGYTRGSDAAAEDSGCGIAARGNSADARWLSLLVPLALGLAARRRRAAR